MPAVKKIFIISSSLFIATLVFGSVYFFVFREKSTSNEDKKNIKNSAEEAKEKTAIILPQKARRIFSVTEEVVLAPTISEDGDHIKYYTRPNGHVFEVLEKGQGKKTISNTDLPALEKVIWSPDKNKVISFMKRGDSKTKYVYDYNIRSGKKLPEGIEEIVWANLGDKIVYRFFIADTARSVLSIADADGSNWKNLADIPWHSTRIAPIPSSSLISFWNTPNGFESTVLKVVSVAGGDAKTIFENKFGADYLWSPNGEKALISTTENKGGSKIFLGKINRNGGQYQNFNIPTLVSKCVWSKNNKTVYLALPNAFPEGLVMPNDYLSGKIKTQDTFWRLDSDNGKQERLVELDEIGGSFDATDLFLSASESILYFINRNDGRLYGIEL